MKKFLATVHTTDGQTNVAEIPALDADEAIAIIARSQGWMFRNADGNFVTYFQHAVTRVEVNPTPAGTVEEPHIINPSSTLAH